VNKITIVFAALAASFALPSFAAAERVSPSECRYLMENGVVMEDVVVTEDGYLIVEDRSALPAYIECPSAPDEARGNLQGSSGAPRGPANPDTNNP
jgi:hypothetical protein